jgi:hypothetical protein
MANMLAQLGQPYPEMGPNRLPPGGRPSTQEEIDLIDQMLRTRPPSSYRTAPMPSAPNAEQDLRRQLQRPPSNPDTEFPDLLRRPGQGMPMSGMQPPITLASMGQRYRDMPPATFDQRFGPYQAPGPTDDARNQLRRMLEEQMLPPGAIVPGQQLVDPNGFRGVRHPSGYYMLRGI